MTDFLETMKGWDQFAAVNDRQIDEAALVKTLGLLTNESRHPPHRHKYLLQEAITTSDFPYLFGQVIDRQLIANYQAWNADWQNWCKFRVVTDFNTVRLERLYGIDDLLPEVAEKGEYTAQKPTSCRFPLAVKKYGKQFDVSWESIVNDSLGAFSDVPSRMGTAAARTENYLVTSTYSSATGPNAALFGDTITDCGQDVTNAGTLPLSLTNIETTLELMRAQTDPNGNPINVRGTHLVVPPALEMTGRSILSSALKMYTESAGGGATPYPTTNIIPQMGLKLHVDPWLPVVDTSGNANTTWYLFADPSQIPAIYYGRLRGYETPEVVMKSSDKVTATGGSVTPMSGDFTTDNIMYRVRLVFGTVAGDPRAAYSQTGTA